MGALARWRRKLRRQVSAVPRRGRRAARIAITYAETAAAVRRDKDKRHDDALRLLHDAARRSPKDMRVARLRSQVLARTGQLSDAVAEASRLAMTAPSGKNVRLQRAVQGRFVETDPGWRPRVPGAHPAVLAEPVPGRVLYLAKESMPHRNNGYCTRTHETLLAVKGAGRDPVAVTLPGFPSVTSDRTAGPSSTVDGIEYHHVMPGAAQLSAVTWEEYVQLTTTTFARQVARVRPQVLHAGSGHRGYDLGVVGQALSDWAGLPWIYEVRSFFETTWTADERYAEHAEYYRRRFAAETRAMRAADAVVTLSGPMREEIVHGHGVPEDKVFVIPNAVDLQRFQPEPRDTAMRTRLGLDGTFVLGYVSNLDHYREGQEVLLSAAALLRAQGLPVSVLLVGEGRRRAELEAHAAELGLGAAAVFAGSVPFDEVPQWYAQIDLFVVPRVPERAGRMVSPMKPFEAMAMEIPLLVSDLPALVEIAGDEQGRAGVFTAGDPSSLAQVVAHLTDHPEDLAKRVAEAADWVRRERTWSGNGKAFDAVYAFAEQRYAERAR
ncbi:glycosyltransferase family 4 protein [Kineosporia succinea]|uniref:Glycosyltransferase involved in cell wall biosynthesis n=1 Tax=Kineosporia succinea TaxID=84632 RepID=A0ABT9NYP7_9ACTN|nr:glycosyltransferase family 4 protein [Kineosporia succinea]MDP9825421.1 glycosyltransferase involved in cell wall biosynthesis [Kineosporia succinea]